jgi:hypothetical protein
MPEDQAHKIAYLERMAEHYQKQNAGLNMALRRAIRWILAELIIIIVLVCYIAA